MPPVLHSHFYNVCLHPIKSLNLQSQDSQVVHTIIMDLYYNYVLGIAWRFHSPPYMHGATLLFAMCCKQQITCVYIPVYINKVACCLQQESYCRKLGNKVAKRFASHRKQQSCCFSQRGVLKVLIFYSVLSPIFLSKNHPHV